jgi:hypothetical protein
MPAARAAVRLRDGAFRGYQRTGCDSGGGESWGGATAYAQLTLRRDGYDAGVPVIGVPAERPSGKPSTPGAMRIPFTGRTRTLGICCTMVPVASRMVTITFEPSSKKLLSVRAHFRLAIDSDGGEEGASRV